MISRIIVGSVAEGAASCRVVSKKLIV